MPRKKAPAKKKARAKNPPVADRILASWFSAETGKPLFQTVTQRRPDGRYFSFIDAYKGHLFTADSREEAEQGIIRLYEKWLQMSPEQQAKERAIEEAEEREDEAFVQELIRRERAGKVERIPFEEVLARLKKHGRKAS